MKRVLIIISFSIISYTAYGQSLFARFGGSLTSVKNLIAYPENRISWYGGIGCQVKLSEKISFLPEIVYSSKGYRTDNGGNRDFYTSLRLNYLGAPLLLSYGIDKKTQLIFGFEVAYLMSAIYVIDRNQRFNVINEFPPRLDAGLCLGVKRNFTRRISVDLRYNYGFNTLYSVDAIGNRNSQLNAANRALQLGINYSLFLK